MLIDQEHKNPLCFDDHMFMLGSLDGFSGIIVTIIMYDMYLYHMSLQKVRLGFWNQKWLYSSPI